MNKARRRGMISNLVIVAGSVAASWCTWALLSAGRWPLGGEGVYRMAFALGYFAIGWRLRERYSYWQDELRWLVIAFVSTGSFIADLGSDTFDSCPGPNIIDAYLLLGVMYGLIWWVRAVTNEDFRRMCGNVVLAGAAFHRALLWPKVLVEAVV